MDHYEYEGHRVIMMGIDVNGDHYVETREGFSIVETDTTLTAGLMYIAVGEVCDIFGVHHVGQNVINPLRRS